MLNMLQMVAEFSVARCIQAASVAFVFYYLYAKTSAPALIGNLLPNSTLYSLNIGWTSMSKLLAIVRNGAVWIVDSKKRKESKAHKTLAHGIGTQNMLELTPHAGPVHYRSFFDWGTYMPFVAQSLRSKKFSYPQVAPYVIKDAKLKVSIKQAAERILQEQHNLSTNSFLPSTSSSSTKTDTENDEYQRILKQQERRALTILKDMRSTLNNFLLALTSWVLYKLLPCFLSGVVIHTQQIDMLKKISERNPGVPLIFLPLHRSHLDYIMVTFILTNNDIRSPLVAAGNNLQIPVFGGLLRGLGAFFIKRKIDPVVGKKDIIYRAVLQQYLQHALHLGHNVEFFIEGGRTRTGKPCMPKGGILSVIVDAFMDRSITDALLVPVSVNYERLVDGNFVSEQTGEKKVPETFMKAMSGIWKALNSNYGLMRIDFNEPYSIRNLVNTYKRTQTGDDGLLKTYENTSKALQHNQSTSSLYGTDVICEEHRSLVDSISRQVVYDCAAATSVMSTNALSFLLLTRYREGAPLKQIAESLDELRKTLCDHKEIGFSGDSMHVINYACDLLGKDLVTCSSETDGTQVIRPVDTIESFIELSYYSHTLTPHFALQSILLTSFHALLKEKPCDLVLKDASNSNNNKQCEAAGVSRSKLMALALENCDVYRYEYILNKPTQTLAHNLDLALDELVMRDLLKEGKLVEDDFQTRKILRHLEDVLDDFGDNYDDDVEHGFVNLDNGPLVHLQLHTIEEQRAVCEVLAPCSYTYLTVAQSLPLLYKNSMLESEFIKYVIKELREKIKSKQCRYGESISTDSVRNCLKLLEKWSVIEICNRNGLRLLCLSSSYESSKESLQPVIQRIAETVPNYKNAYFKQI